MAKVLSSSKVIDDRGREFPTVRIAGTHVWDGRDEAAEMTRELESACAAAVEEFGASHRSSLFSIWGMVWLALWIAIWIGWRPVRNFSEVLAMAIIGIGNAIGWEIYRRSGSRRPYDERILATLLAAARCPSCGYDLEPVRAADGECSCCPECGAAWRLPRRFDLPLRMPGVSDPVVSELEHPAKDRVSYADGRGRAVWLIDSALKVMPHAWCDVPESKQARIAECLGGRHGVERAMYVFGGLGAAAFGCLLFATGFWGSTLSVVISLVLFLSALGSIWLAWTSKSAGDGQTIAQIFLTSWVCPSCATPFENPQEESDGCITCPTCRAAWRVKGAVAESPGTV